MFCQEGIKIRISTWFSISLHSTRLFFFFFFNKGQRQTEVQNLGVMSSHLSLDSCLRVYLPLSGVGSLVCKLQLRSRSLGEGEKYEAMLSLCELDMEMS